MDTSVRAFSLTWIPSFEFPARLFSRLLSEGPGSSHTELIDTQLQQTGVEVLDMVH